MTMQQVSEQQIINNDLTTNSNTNNRIPTTVPATAPATNGAPTTPTTMDSHCATIDMNSSPTNKNPQVCTC